MYRSNETERVGNTSTPPPPPEPCPTHRAKSITCNRATYPASFVSQISPNSSQKAEKSKGNRSLAILDLSIVLPPILWPLDVINPSCSSQARGPFFLCRRHLLRTPDQSLARTAFYYFFHHFESALTTLLPGRRSNPFSP